MLYRVIGTALDRLDVVLCRFAATFNTQIAVFCVILLYVTADTGSPGASSACTSTLSNVLEEYEYYQDGDIIIGGIFTVNSVLKGLYFQQSGLPKFLFLMFCKDLQPQFYKNLLVYFFAIDEINKNPTMLPNMTLGYHLYDSCGDSRKALKNTLEILSGPGKMFPNYSCRHGNKILGFIGDQSSDTTASIAQLMSMYWYVQISYGATNLLLNDKRVFPTLFRMVRNDFVIYSNLAQMLNYFGWNWIGIISSGDDSGKEEFIVLIKVLNLYKICVFFHIIVQDHVPESIKKFNEDHSVKQASLNVIVLCGTVLHLETDLLQYLRGYIEDRTVILSPTWASNVALIGKHPEIFNCSLSFRAKPTRISEFQNFVHEFQPQKKPKDVLLDELWLKELGCSSLNEQKNIQFKYVYNISFHECNGTERITDIPNFLHGGNGHLVYHAVYAMASALHDMLEFMKRRFSGGQIYSFKHQNLLRYIKATRYSSENSSQNYFNEDGEFVTQYVIQNHLLVNNTLLTNDVGYFQQDASSGRNIFINASLIKWKNDQKEIPRSQCSEDCLPGNRQVPSADTHECCYGCVPCSEGEMSNVTGSKNCMTCADHEWPNEKKTQCNFKQIEFLSYTDDNLSLSSIAITLFFCILTVLVTGIFLSYGDTPIVRANNKSLSFVLLLSILLGFLCVFLFLGRPTDTTCRLRQVSFAILFTIAVSCVLAKTVMVWLAFKATKPGSVWKKWVGVKLPNCIVFICSSFQVVICIAWLMVSPPFQELDTRSYQTKIIIQCNEGSVIGFYSVLGYMGVLAAVSFITAFLARTLPDSFNEAKYITFSMLVFCSVWIAMIPAYVSTKGKYVVAVEIFAILTSNAGLLVCIFVPKCYIILCHPDLNSRKHLLDNSCK